MKFKYTGPEKEVTVRHITFKKNKVVPLDPENRADALLAQKVEGMAGFRKVKNNANTK